jgi:hypothetical protein
MGVMLGSSSEAMVTWIVLYFSGVNIPFQLASVILSFDTELELEFTYTPSEWRYMLADIGRSELHNAN